MPVLRPFHQRRLSTREATAVILCAVAFAGLVWCAFEFAAAKILEAKVDAVLPKVAADARTQRDLLVKAIEAYRAQFGIYPPSHILNRQPLVVDAVTNTLLYELAGVVYNPANNTFTAGHLERADANFVKAFFQCGGFTNCATREEGLKRFLPDDSLPYQQLHDDPDVFVLGFALNPEGADPDVVYEIDASSWRYVSTSPNNNPKSFDLWIELKTATRTNIIGNWKTAE